MLQAVCQKGVAMLSAHRCSASNSRSQRPSVPAVRLKQGETNAGPCGTADAYIRNVPRHSVGERITTMGTQHVNAMRAGALIITGLCLSLITDCGKSQPATAEASAPLTDPPKAEPKSSESRSVESSV